MPTDPIAFMEEIRSRFREKQSAPSAWNLLTLALAQHHLRANHTEQAEELLRSTREALGIVSDEELPLTSPLRESDGSTAIKDDVLSLYYAVLAEQAQVRHDAIAFHLCSLLALVSVRTTPILLAYPVRTSYLSLLPFRSFLPDEQRRTQVLSVQPPLPQLY